MPVKKREKFKIAILLFLTAFFFSLVLIYIIPTGDFAPDESSHLKMVEFLAKEKRLPVFDKVEDLGPLIFQPQLWNEKFRTGAYYSMAYNSPLSYFGYVLIYNLAPNFGNRGGIILLRILSALYFAGFSLFLFLALLKINPRKVIQSASLAFFAAFIPQVIFSGSYINIEPFALLLSAISFYLLVWLKSNASASKLLLFGLSLGMLSLTKTNYLALVVTFLALALFFIWPHYQKNRRRFFDLLLVISPILLSNIFWWLRNLKLYDDPLIINFIQERIKITRPEWFLPPGEAGYNTLSIIIQPDFSRNTFLGFYAALGRLDIFFPSIFYIIFYLIVFGLISTSIFHSAKDFVKGKRGEFLFQFTIILFIAINFLIFANKNLLDFSPQGRHLFPMLLPIFYLLYNGLKILPQRFSKALSTFLVSFSSFSVIFGAWLMLDRYHNGYLEPTINRLIPAVLALIFLSLFLRQLIIIAKGENES